MSDMNFDRWVERIYNERDIGRGIATTTSGAAGLVTYIFLDDWVVAAFVAVIVFPIGRILASGVHSRWSRSRQRSNDRDKIKEIFESLGLEEKAVVQGFVWHGGSVITWRECNQSPHFPFAGIESLINRNLVHTSMTADGMRETFTLDVELFDYAQTVLPKVPF